MRPDFSYFKERRTVRNFKPEAPSQEMINEILELAMRAPTTGNMQLYSVIVTRSEDGLAKLRPAHFNQPASMAPVLITVCADVSRFEHWCKVSDATPEFRNLQVLTAAVLDAALLAQQITTVAEMMGLGTCWLGTTTYNAPEIAEALRLPKGVVPVGTLSIGFPNGDTPQCERLPLRAWVYDEMYPEFPDEAIRSLYSAKDDFADNRQFVKENNKQTLAQVFTDVRYPASTTDPFSEKFREFLLNAGFRI